MIDQDDETRGQSVHQGDKHLLIRFESTNRLYAARLSRDLFGEWIVEQVWGGRFNRLGNSRTRPVESFEAGLNVLSDIVCRREARGYTKMRANEFVSC